MKLGIITPIGPGHRAIYESRCRPSVAQAVAFDLGPFEEVVLFEMDDSEGRHGRSQRRNQAVSQALTQGIDWLFLLDADDALTPNAFEAFGRRLAEAPGAAAIWGLICVAEADGSLALREEQPESLESFDAFLATRPHLAVQIGGFIRTEALAAFGFDEAMDTGEDYKLYLQLWESCACRKVPEIFFVNHRDTRSEGPRSATGLAWRDAVARLWAEAVAAHPLWAEVADGAAVVRMRVSNPNDLIQGTHLAGSFFDASALARLKALLRPGARIVDVGANVGNHVVWYARQLEPAAILPVEPNPAAIALLDENIAANDLGALVDRRGIGLGAGRSEGRFRAETADGDNLGATTLVEDPEGSLRVVALDALLGDSRVDFIKIDAEGMELEVLAGAAGVIARDRPVIWVETLRKNLLPFAQGWCRANGYCLADAEPHVFTMDYFAVPMERA